MEQEFEITFKLDGDESIHTVSFTTDIEKQSDDDLEDLVYINSTEIDVNNTKTIKIIDTRAIAKGII